MPGVPCPCLQEHKTPNTYLLFSAGICKGCTPLCCHWRKRPTSSQKGLVEGEQEPPLKKDPHTLVSWLGFQGIPTSKRSGFWDVNSGTQKSCSLLPQHQVCLAQEFGSLIWLTSEMIAIDSRTPGRGHSLLQLLHHLDP